MVRASGRPSLTSWDIVFWTFHDLGASGGTWTSQMSAEGTALGSTH